MVPQLRMEGGEMPKSKKGTTKATPGVKPRGKGRPANPPAKIPASFEEIARAVLRPEIPEEGQEDVGSSATPDRGDLQGN